jgi:hypothetical protein
MGGRLPSMRRGSARRVEVGVDLAGAAVAEGVVVAEGVDGVEGVVVVGVVAIGIEGIGRIGS